jgi:hypothetical protein
MRSVFVFTNGGSNDLATWWSRGRYPPRPVEDRSGIIEPLTAEQLQMASADLDRDGIHVFPRRVHEEVLEALLAFAHSAPSRPRGDHLPTDTPADPFDPNRVVAPTYWFDAKNLANNPAVQLAFLDPSMRRLAQAYLRVEPILDLHAMWWSVPYGPAPDASSAQMYHFDMDRLKWLKFFIYLTDVGPENGPHVFLRGTHVRKPRALLRDGRIPDDEVYRHWPRERALEVVGPAGTLFAADTRAFHKGKAVTKGHRLVLEVQFSADLYGYEYPRSVLGDGVCPDFLREMAKHPRTYSMFVREEHDAVLGTSV